MVTLLSMMQNLPILTFTPNITDSCIMLILLSCAIILLTPLFLGIDYHKLKLPYKHEFQMNWSTNRQGQEVFLPPRISTIESLSSGLLHISSLQQKRENDGVLCFDSRLYFVLLLSLYQVSMDRD